MKSMLKRIGKGLKYIIKGTHTKYITAKVTYLSPSERLEGKKILLTGGSRGLGYAMANKFRREGAEVLITGRNIDTLKTAAETIGCSFLVWDITDTDKADSILEEADHILGGIDVLVSNAGISLHEGNILNVSEEDFDRQFDTNLRGAYFLAQRFIGFIERKNLLKADILFVSSERGEYVDDLPYGISKNALNCLVRGLARRYTGKGIRVNAVAPGVTASEMTGFEPDDNLYVGYNTNERVYLPEEVAEVACFLLSDASRCVSGQIIVCNEGKSINSHWR